jgi:broad specificity phosphatase PhoE
MELVFVRHGQSMGNMTGDYSTPAHDQLSPNGWQQAEQLASRLEQYTFDAIYVSPLRRALETATPYLRQVGRAAEVWPELAEACWQADRDAAPTLDRLPPRSFSPSESISGPYVPRPGPLFWAPEGETYREGVMRVARVRTMLQERHSGKHEIVLVVGHEFAGGRLVELLLGVEPLGRFYHANTGLTRLVEGTNGTFIARFINRL